MGYVHNRARKRTELESNYNGSVRFDSIRTEPEPAFGKLDRTEPNPNRSTSIRFGSSPFLSLEKSSYILNQVLSFLPNESLVEG